MSSDFFVSSFGFVVVEDPKVPKGDGLSAAATTDAVAAFSVDLSSTGLKPKPVKVGGLSAAVVVVFSVSSEGLFDPKPAKEESLSVAAASVGLSAMGFDPKPVKVEAVVVVGLVVLEVLPKPVPNVLVPKENALAGLFSSDPISNSADVVGGSGANE